MRKVWLGLIIASLIGYWVLESGGFNIEGRSKWPSPTTVFYVDIPGADGLWNRAFEGAMAEWNVRTIFHYQIDDSFQDPGLRPSPRRNGVKFGTYILNFRLAVWSVVSAFYRAGAACSIHKTGSYYLVDRFRPVSFQL